MTTGYIILKILVLNTVIKVHFIYRILSRIARTFKCKKWCAIIGCALYLENLTNT